MASRNFNRFPQLFFVFFLCLAVAPAMDQGGERFSVIQDPLPEVSLILNANGFDPSEVRPQSGRFFLSIDNRSGAGELVLRLSRLDGTQIRELKIPGGGGDWSEALDLSAGTYKLTEANHSSWICTIIIQ